MSEMLLNGSRISAKKIMKEGYHFRYANLQIALIDLLEKTDK
jgi:NAD dependent epimerase/dehydratase family enzyme